jgi:hypothetical protein
VSVKGRHVEAGQTGFAKLKCACTEGSGNVCDLTRWSSPDVYGSQDFRTECCKGAFLPHRERNHPRIAQFDTFLLIDIPFASEAMRKSSTGRPYGVRAAYSDWSIHFTYTSADPVKLPRRQSCLHKLKAEFVVTPSKAGLTQWLTRCNALYGNQSKTLFTPHRLSPWAHGLPLC